MVAKPAPAAEPLLTPTPVAASITEAYDEIREAYRPPVNTLFLHAKQMEVYVSTCRFKVVVAGRRWGKALALDTPIPTPHGWTTMGELRDGDEVFDESGKPCRVTHAHAVMHDRPCYEVEFSDGTKIVADEEHLWSTWDKSARKNVRRNPSGTHGPRVRTTRQIIDTLKVGTDGENNHSVPCAGAVQYPEAPLPLDPYVLGAWLGDGDSRCAAITCGNEELPHFAAAIESLVGARPHITQDRRTGAWRIAITRGRGCKCEFQKGLHTLGLMRNKHIPRAYLQGSVAQRLALLQGLMDTDGSIFEHAGNCEFTSVNKRLADDVLELALSMGIKATMITGVAKLNGRDCGVKYRIRFTTAMQVFRLPRKAEKNVRARKLRVDHRFIVAVRPVKSVPVRCITVDSPNALYLCSRAFIPTHNTQLAKVSLIKFARKKRRLIWYVAPSYRMAKQIMWPELVESIPRAWVKKYNETILTITLVNGSKIELKGADNPDSLRGVGIHYLVMDEVQDIDPDAWIKVLRPTLASTGGHALFIGCVRGDTKVLTRSGPIEIASLSKGEQEKSILPIDLEVYGINREYHRADGFWNNGVVKTRVIDTRKGFQIEASEPHPVMVMKEHGTPVWKRTDQLEVGDRVAIGRGMEQWGGKDPLAGFDGHIDKWRESFRGKRGPKPTALVNNDEND